VKKSSSPKADFVHKVTNPGLNCEAQQLTISTLRWLLVLASILYSVTAAAADDWGPIQFLIGRWTGQGSGASGQSRYRMIYASSGPDRVKIKFQIAPPGQDFAGYIEATARREGSKARQ
jgi:hypothetical protein